MTTTIHFKVRTSDQKIDQTFKVRADDHEIEETFSEDKNCVASEEETISHSVDHQESTQLNALFESQSVHQVNEVFLENPEESELSEEIQSGPVQTIDARSCTLMYHEQSEDDLDGYLSSQSTFDESGFSSLKESDGDDQPQSQSLSQALARIQASSSASSKHEMTIDSPDELSKPKLQRKVGRPRRQTPKSPNKSLEPVALGPQQDNPTEQNQNCLRPKTIWNSTSVQTEMIVDHPNDEQNGSNQKRKVGRPRRTPKIPPESTNQVVTTAKQDDESVQNVPQSKRKVGRPKRVRPNSPNQPIGHVPPTPKRGRGRPRKISSAIRDGFHCMVKIKNDMQGRVTIEKTNPEVTMTIAREDTENIDLNAKASSDSIPKEATLNDVNHDTSVSDDSEFIDPVDEIPVLDELLYCHECKFKGLDELDLKDHFRRYHRQYCQCKHCKFVCLNTAELISHYDMFHC